ncbi:meiotically up-regulated gene 9 protein [Diplogelasinospora grovesii]|uniref:Meiotically up-regulated gene 9 protein n=1 Tax=Diplogelasinospora grovesii TaxID=303347 RepID=A0AAN6S7B3_9PEZI|nr:meiotically up-regulated gene 9 protein [Diplogelasinospora grovesii]
MANQTSYPPPAPSHNYVQAQQPQQHQSQNQQVTQQKSRPQPQSRKSRSFSFRSDKSHGSGNKIDLRETSAEKESKRLHSKADPTLAMNEAEPSEIAANLKSSLAPLRNIQHKDAFGNPIADPDRSNPTRSRWERPLDTIRAFEAAIDGDYNKRRSFLRSESESVAWGNSRRNSHYGGNGVSGRFPHESYYGGRPPSTIYANRGEGSQYDLRHGAGGQRDGFHDQHNGYPPSSQNPGRRMYPRMASEPQFVGGSRQQQPNEYTLPSNHRSYETVASASGSGTSGEPPGYQTDPTSSDNSSVERMQATAPKRKPEPVNDYGIGFSQNTTYQAPTFTLGVRNNGMNGRAVEGYQSPANVALGYGNGNSPAPPPVPQKERGTILRKPTATEFVQERPAAPEKRKSWFARRFSKQAA